MRAPEGSSVGRGREAEQAVGQKLGLGMGGMSLSDSNSEETENSNFRLSFEAIMKVYLSR